MEKVLLIETLKEGVKDADVLISLLSTNVDKEVIDAGSNLKIITNYGAGFNNVDVDYAREKISTLPIRRKHLRLQLLN